MTRTERPHRRARSEKPLLIGWNSTLGLNTTLTVEQGALYLTTHIDTLRTAAVRIPGQGKPHIEALSLDGTALLLASGDIRAQATAYHLRDRLPSRLSGLRISLPAGGRRIQAYVPGLQLTPDLNAFIADSPAVAAVVVESPRLQELPPVTPTFTPLPPTRLPGFTLDSLRIEDAAWTGNPGRLPGNGPLRFTSADIRISGIRSDSLSLTLDSLQADLLRPEWTGKRFRLGGIGDAPARITLTQLARFGEPARSHTSARLEHLRIPRLDMRVGDGIRLQADNAELAGIHLHDGMRTDPAGLLADQHGLTLSAQHLAADNPAWQASLHGLRYANGSRHLQADSMDLSPRLDPEAFTRQYPVQKDHVRLHSGTLTASGLQPAAAFTDTLLHATHVAVDRPALAIHRDRRLPRKPGVRPLPGAFAAHLPLHLRIDTLEARNGSIDYHELRTGTPVHVLTRQTNLSVVGLQSQATAGDDSLRLDVEARLQDTVRLRLRYREAYADTLHGFLLALRTGPFALPALNTLLEPMASARLRRGRVDTIAMKAAGNDRNARNAMRMRYRDLKLQFLNPGDTTHKTLRTRLKNLLANTLLRRVSIRSAAAVRTERDPHRGFLHYWVRMTLHGFLANAGIRIDTLQEIGTRRKRQRPAPDDIPDLLDP